MVKKYLPLAILSILFVLLLLFLNSRNSLNFVEDKQILEISTTPTEAPWQTYRNEKYGFEFQYPSYYLLSETNESIDGYYSVALTDMSKKVEDMSGKLEYAKVFSVAYVSDFSYLCSKMCEKYSSVTVGSNTFVPYYDGGLYNGNSYFTNKHYSIWTGNWEDPIIHQILSTLKFTNSSLQKPDTTNWKTYTDQTFGFSFKYPPQYQVIPGSLVNNGNSNRWGIYVVDTSTKIQDMSGKDINKPIFDITQLSEFKYDPDANTPKENLTIGNNTFKYFQATKYEMFDIFHFEISNLNIVSYQENQHLINPIFDQILSSFKFTK